MADESNRNGGADFNAEEVRVGQDVVGRDKFVQNITQQVAPVEKHDSLPNQPYFFGRKEELAKIADALDPEAQGWGVLISGPGGIGKTALAIRSGQLAPEEHFPIKIFISAKVIQLTPQGVEDLQDFMLPNYMTLLAELARELGDENIAKIDPNLRVNEVRRLLADRHTLIIIDNLETFDEKTERPRVFQFLSRLPRTCKAIVTSRRRIDTPAEIIRLDKLERADALQLIAKIAERNRHVAKTTEAERIDLYEITRGNPLLMEWLAGQLGNPKSQCRTMAEACKFMESAPKDNDPLEFVFGDLLDTFTEHETAVLAALTYFTQPAEVRWIAVIAQITTPQAETALEDLADRSVLVAVDNRYLLPQLTVTYLRRARPEVIVKAGDSLCDRAYVLAQENGYRQFERFSILEAEWPTLAAALPLFAHGSNDRLQKLCVAIQKFLEFAGYWDELLSLCLQAEDTALAAGDVYAAGRRAYDAGWMYYFRNQSLNLLDCTNRTAKHWQNATNIDKHTRARATYQRGTYFQLIKDYAAAVRAYRQALGVFQSLEDKLWIAIVMDSLATAEQMMLDYSAAKSNYLEALRIAEEINNQEVLAYVKGDLAELALTQNDWPTAAQYAREALPLSEWVGRLDLIALNCRRLAQSLVLLRGQAEALPYAQRAVTIFTKLRSPELAEAQAVLKECEEGPKQQI